MNEDPNKQAHADQHQEKPKRRRGLTSVTLQWLAEKFRRAEQIKDQLDKGTYQMDSQKIAKALISGADGEAGK